MKITRIDRMEMVEDILQEKIRNTEQEMASLGEMKDAEICRLRIMYLLDLQEMRHSLITLRRRLEMAYTIDRRERRFHDEISDFGKMPGNHADAEEDQQQRVQERGAGRRAGRGLRHVRPDGTEPAGDDEGKAVRAGLKNWQIKIMEDDVNLKPVSMDITPTNSRGKTQAE